ncbi:hypothetical protein CAPTEDRAFT_217576 [Capitella teleta]|uniref:Uncharacterized protein n=1 Tax=Capitella teleta TaxID=283909 RepID=R7TBS5_CAPTE|nr:hypothetical protein CAPTEDRAFT_217576 [Capitella teleta]|eukprot:ELT91164.1 hypothetical protein CAPTEDRAFT_217576 [Capitella teleta]
MVEGASVSGVQRPGRRTLSSIEWISEAREHERSKKQISIMKFMTRKQQVRNPEKSKEEHQSEEESSYFSRRTSEESKENHQRKQSSDFPELQKAEISRENHNRKDTLLSDSTDNLNIQISVNSEDNTEDVFYSKTDSEIDEIARLQAESMGRKFWLELKEISDKRLCLDSDTETQSQASNKDS